MMRDLSAASPRLGASHIQRQAQRGGAISQAGGPSSWLLVAFLSLFLIPVSLIPSTWGRMVPMPFVGPVWWTDALMLVFAAAAMTLRFVTPLSYRSARTTKRRLLYPFLALGLWQTISVAWNGRESVLKAYSVWESILMCGTVVAAVSLGSGLGEQPRRRLARLVTILLGGIISVYMVLSFIFPSWRPSAASTNLVTPTLGFIRVFGPLGAATALNFILVPALGLSIGALLSKGSVKSWWAGACMFFLFAVLATGSRGGLLCLLGFTLTLVVALGVRSLAIIVPCAALFAIIIVLGGVPERFRSFEDESRAVTYATAWRALTSSPGSIMFGMGHGAMYSRLHDESMRREYGQSQWYLFSERTEFGETLRSSHTALLRTLVESGIVGGIILFGTFGWIALHLLRHASRERRPFVAEGKALLAGCAGVIPYMALDEFFVGTPWIVFLWFLYVALGSEMVRSE